MYGVYIQFWPSLRVSDFEHVQVLCHTVHVFSSCSAYVSSAADDEEEEEEEGGDDDDDDDDDDDAAATHS